MLTAAGYPTKVFPPLEPAEQASLTSMHWADIKSQLITATAEVHAAVTTDDLREAIKPLMDPEHGVLERITALLDTAAQRVTGLDENAPAASSASELAHALQSASTALTSAGYRIVTPGSTPADEAASARATAALTHTAATLPAATQAETFPSVAPAAQRPYGSAPSR
ncbi:hypothetical protein [Kitasatospora sp. NPDC127116]|uniref:hypothetical protein n=1 Tax=Kitasatospora sp. NPDC127116 TaxID=3345367 RepID=UPI003627490C